MNASRLERWLLAAVAVLVVAVGVRAGLKAADERSAFCRWRGQLLAMSAGKDISREFNYPNPPIMAVLLEPLAHLPPLAGSLAWFGLKTLMAGLSLFWVVRLVQAGGPAFPPWARVLAVLLALKPILDDLSHGNVNLFILFLCMACLTAHASKRDLLAGCLLALAVACKVTPALFLPYFLWKRAWRLLAGAVLGCLLFFYPGFVPAARLGMDANLEQLGSWYGVMVKPFLEEGKATSEHINQSLPGTLFRLASRSPSFVVFVKDKETPARYDNLLSLPPATVKAIVKGCMLGFVLLVVLACHARRRDGWQAAAEYGMIFLGMLLFSERTWKHHAVTLALPFAVLAYRAPRQRALWAVLAACAVLLLLPAVAVNQDRDTAWRAPGLGKTALVYGCYTALFLIQLGTLAVLLRRDLRASPIPAAVPTVEPVGPAAAA